MKGSEQDISRFFRGWAKPGPLVDSPSDVAEGETSDALSGSFRVYQLREGHRFSTDDLLVAWYGNAWCPCPQNILDLGSGVSSIGMMAAWKFQGARVVAVEAQAVSVELARKSIKHNRLKGRYEIRHGDFRDPKLLSAEERFDLVFGSPPYFPVGTGVQSEHPQKLACRFELRGSVSDYCKAASRHLGWGGIFTCIFPMHPKEQSLRVARAAADAHLIVIRKRPVVLCEGEAPLLCLYVMGHRDHFPEDFRLKTWVEPELVIRRKDGSPHPEYSAVKVSVGFPP